MHIEAVAVLTNSFSYQGVLQYVVKYILLYNRLQNKRTVGLQITLQCLFPIINKYSLSYDVNQ